MFETIMYIVYALAAIYFTVGIIVFWRHDKVTRKADRMLEELKEGDKDGILEVESNRQA